MVSHIESADGLHEKDILNKGFPFRLILNENKDFNWPMHWHNATELLYVKESKFEITYNNEEHLLNESDIVYIPAGRLHGFNSSTKTGKRIFLNYDFSLFENYIDHSKIDIHLHDITIFSKNKNGGLYCEIESNLEKLIEEYNQNNPACQLAIIARILDIYLLIYRSIMQKIDCIATDNNISRNCGFERISGAFKYIEKNYMASIKLKDVSNAAGFSEYHFSRIFKAITDKNFREYLNEFRIKKAEKSLMDFNNTIADTANLSGFSNISTFERLFKKANGCTPLEYRKRRIN
jgi:AraC-like DNA-binding protein